MAFGGLTSGERKRLQQGILSPQAAELVSARAIAKGGGGGFWTSTWGQVIRGVGIAALNFIPGVGAVASQAVGAYDQQRFAALQKNAVAKYQEAALTDAQRAAKARQPVAPVLETSPYPWLPDWGNIGGQPGYAGGIINPGGSASAPGTDTMQGIQDALAGISPFQWLAIGGAALLLILLILGGRK